MPSYVRAGIRKCARIRALSMETINDPTEYGFIDSRVYKRLKYKERRMREAIDGDVLKPEVTDDLLADVRSIIENERRSIAKAHAKTVNVEIE